MGVNMSIYEKLLNVQSKIKVLKSQYSEFGDYYFRSVEDIQSELKPICKEEGVVIICADSILCIGERYYVKATVTMIDIDTQEQVECCAFAREEFEKKKVDGSQLTGMASSYARKYALGGLLLLDDNKDSDGVKEELPKRLLGSALENAKKLTFSLNGIERTLGDCNLEQLLWLQKNATTPALIDGVNIILGETNEEGENC